ncbi:MAG: hypothetical protein IKC03_02220 [Oscillospiraceae bacterium]|nr:hypothetical protein [Oscillospiraceae bacterium]
MKQKTLKIIAAVTAFAILIGLAWFANAMVGNPISKLLAERAAEKHLEETYAGTDYYIERVSYNFKDGNYHVFVKSPTSVDTEFSFYLTMFGKLRLDTYEDVINGFNTARRIEQEYRILTNSVLEHPSFPYTCHIGYGTLEIYPEIHLNDPNADDIPSYAINQNTLILDKIYNIQELGRQAGHLIIYVESDIVSVEKAVEIILNIRAIFDEAGVPFAAMDFTLQYPRPEEGKRPDGKVHVANFLYDAIYETGMADRVEDADKALTAFYAEQDVKYKK